MSRTKLNLAAAKEPKPDCSGRLVGVPMVVNKAG